MERYKNIANTYYNMKARVMYGINYFKGKTITDTNMLATYKAMLGNVEAAYHNLIKIKAELNLPLFDFNSYEGEGFFIHRGKLYGSITKAKEYADKLIGENKDKVNENDESCRLFELGLYLKYYCEKFKKKQYEELPEGMNFPAIKAEPVKDVPKETLTEKPVKKDSNISSNTNKENGVSNNIFGIFSAFAQQANVAIG